MNQRQRCYINHTLNPQGKLFSGRLKERYHLIDESQQDKDLFLTLIFFNNIFYNMTIKRGL